MSLILRTFLVLVIFFVGYVAIYSLNKPSHVDPTSKIIVAPGFKE